MRRHADDPLTRRQQRLLEPPRDVPAVLDRPHPLLIQATRPPHRGQMPGIVRLDLPAAADPAGALIARRQRVRALSRVRPDHDHVPRPLVWLTPNEADLRRTTVTQGESHASIKSRRRSSDGGGRHKLDRSGQSSRHSSRESARRQPEDLPVGSDVTAQTAGHFDSDRSLGRPEPSRSAGSVFVRAAAAELGLGVSISAVPLCGSDGVAGPVSRTSIGRRLWRALSRLDLERALSPMLVS